MSGGFLRPAFRLLLLAIVAVLGLALSGCALFGPAQQAPAPITEAVASAVEAPAPPVVETEPEESEPTEPAQPKKPKRVVVKPHKVEPPPAPPPPPPPPAPPPPPLIVTRAIDRGAVRGLLDSEVQKADSKVIGRAVDMTVDVHGAPRELVVNLQGFMGIGDRKASFPWSAFRFSPAAKPAPITITIPPNQLAAVGRAKPSTSLATPLAGVPPAPPVPDGQLPLLDATVERPNGAQVGRVIDVLIDGNAQPQAVVIDVSGIINLDRRAIAANWSALHFAPKDKSLRAVMDLNEAQIKASPSYEGGKPIVAVSPAPPASATTAAAAPAASSTTPAPAPTPAPAAAASATSSSSAAPASSARTSR
ncbi:PRC-barrel domain containing protein [Paraburkholderia solisilvae]|uniref:PRC-barrel domain-containing protein n=1 Tax=Paraburkholderia solisilvae TaxID=624376 RepID=A0A6J5DIG8_9BURK|nr:PRC-barrel domain containing protein [Paraburkholderia solisilvae]CAB3752835.1 hypothetical protein LMG29739_01598 [Paraburkholderia solisilvae]